MRFVLRRAATRRKPTVSAATGRTDAMMEVLRVYDRPAFKMITHLLPKHTIPAPLVLFQRPIAAEE